MFSGRGYNLLGRGRVTVSDQHPDPDYQKASLWDGRPGRPFIFGSNSEDRFFQLDGDLALGTGGFNNFPGGIAEGWNRLQSGGGAVTQEGVVKSEDGSAVRFAKAAPGDVAQLARAFTVRSGEWLTIDVDLRGDGALACLLFVQNVNTARFWDGLGWTAVATPVFSVVANSGPRPQGYNLRSTHFQVEDYATTFMDQMTLQVTLGPSTTVGTGLCYADGFSIYADLDLLGLFGLPNLDPSISIELRSDTAGFGGPGNLEATAALRRPSLYIVLDSPAARRYWRVVFKGINSGFGFPTASPAIGEAVLGLSRKMLFNPEYPIHVSFASHNDVNVSGGGESYVSARSETPQRTIELPFQYGSLVGFEDARDFIYLRSAFGANPVVVVPLDTESAVYHGRVGPEWQAEQSSFTQYPATIQIREDPLPSLYP
jgi:hypothetical protein